MDSSDSPAIAPMRASHGVAADLAGVILPTDLDRVTLAVNLAGVYC